jgi:hypothetical protein
MAHYKRLFIAGIMFLLLTGISAWAAEPDKSEATAFFEALKGKDISQALQYCDSRIYIYVMYDVGNGYQYGCDSADLVKRVTTCLKETWILSEDRQRIRIAGDNGSLIDPGDYFRTESFFAIADPKASGDYRQMSNYCKINILAGKGWLFFTRLVDGKMVIYKVTDAALILK